MDDIAAILGIVLLIVILLAALGERLYHSVLAPCYRIRVRVLGKGLMTGVRPAYKSIGLRSYNYYWGEFQSVETDETMKLEMDINLYTDIKEGQRGILTYRKGYALSFQRMGKLKRQEQPFGEKTLDFFSHRL